MSGHSLIQSIDGGGHDFFLGKATIDVLLWCKSNFGVNEALGSEPADKRICTIGYGLLRLHYRDGQVEALEVIHQIIGVGRAGKQFLQFRRVLSGEFVRITAEASHS